MTNTVDVIINGREQTIPSTANTESEILSESEHRPSEYCLFWDDVPISDRGDEHRVGQPVLPDNGDRFVAVPSDMEEK